MVDEEDRLAGAEPEAGEPSVAPANDNGPAEARTRSGTAILMIARLLGWQIAYEEFGKRMAEAANDNFKGSNVKPD
jgi:hypothetical protein